MYVYDKDNTRNNLGKLGEKTVQQLGENLEKLLGEK
jgi:hypothetical protein